MGTSLVRKSTELVRHNATSVDLSLRAWWQGQASKADNAIVSAILAEMHTKSLWMQCRCQMGQNGYPVLCPARLGDVYFLKRLTQRGQHSERCEFWSEQVEKPDPQEKTNTSHKLGIAPSFFLDAVGDGVAQTRVAKDAKLPSKQKGAAVSRMASRLFWLAETAGFQHTPKGFPVRDLLATAAKVNVTPNFTLSQNLFCNPKVWNHGWAESAFKRCAVAGLPLTCWWVQIVTGVDMQARTFAYSDEGKSFTAKVTGELKVFGGDCSSARFPMLLIGAIRKTAKGDVVVERAYAHPIAGEDHWMLLDSNLERQTLNTLLSVCAWLDQDKSVLVEIDKPLHDWNGTGERPDFVLSKTTGTGKHYFVVETMGFEDATYEARKAELASNVHCEVFFDRRNLGDTAGTDLKSAVARWALRRD